MNPGVPPASESRSISSSSGLPFECTSRILRRPLRSGRSTTIWRSKRPGRSSAGSRMSGRLVAAIRMMLSFISNPSISTSSWFSVCSRSSCPPPMPAPRWRPTASISSTNTMHGDACLACSNRSRTREAPTPTNISTKSEPEIEKNGTPASPATARASSVLPVPGGPYRSTPLGIRAPSAWNFFGLSRNSLISCSSSIASSTPATSLNPILGESGAIRFARDFPKLITFEPPPCVRLIMKMKNPTSSRIGRNDSITDPQEKPPVPFESYRDAGIVLRQQILQLERRLVARIVDRHARPVAGGGTQRRRDRPLTRVEDDLVQARVLAALRDVTAQAPSRCPDR